MFFRVAGYLSDATASWAAPAVVFTVFFLPGTLDSRPEICRLYETSKRFKEAVRPEPPGHRPSRGPSYRFFACGGEGRQGGTFPNVASAARVVPKRTGYPTPQAAAPRRSMRAPGPGWRSCRPPPFVSTAFGPPCRRPAVHRRARSLQTAAPRRVIRKGRRERAQVPAPERRRPPTSPHGWGRTSSRPPIANRSCRRSSGTFSACIRGATRATGSPRPSPTRGRRPRTTLRTDSLPPSTRRLQPCRLSPITTHQAAINRLRDRGK